MVFCFTGTDNSLYAARRINEPDAPGYLAASSANRQRLYRCGICEKVCPFASIRIRDGKAVYTPGNCQTCLAYAHACPQKAIQLTVPEKNPNAATAMSTSPCRRSSNPTIRTLKQKQNRRSTMREQAYKRAAVLFQRLNDFLTRTDPECTEILVNFSQGEAAGASRLTERERIRR